MWRGCGRGNEAGPDERVCMLLGAVARNSYCGSEFAFSIAMPI